MTDEPIAAQNTDRELWREREGDYYADSIHVTQQGGIGIDVGGMVWVKPLREWHRLAIAEDNLRRAMQEIVSGEIDDEPENKTDAYWIVRGVALRALEDNPASADEPRYFRDGAREPVPGPPNK